MIRVSIKGLNTAIERTQEIIDNLQYYTTEGMLEAAYEVILPKIWERAPKEYARTVEIIPDYARHRVIIGPTIEYAPLKELGERAKYITRTCIWWRYVRATIRKRIPATPVLGPIAEESRTEIHNRIVQTIKRGLLLR